MNWEAVTGVSTALTGLVIGATAIAGFVQIRQLREQRRDSATVELVRTFQDEAFVRAFDLVLALPLDLSADELRKQSSDVLLAIRMLAIRFEMVGMLVFRRTVSFYVTEEVCGGAVMSVWRRVKTLVEDQRQQQGYPIYLEWFEWLANQFEKRSVSDTPAYIRERDWNPDG